MGSLRLLLTITLVTLFLQCMAQGKVCGKKKLKGKFGTITVKPKGICVLENVKAAAVKVLARGNLTVKGISVIKAIDASDKAIIRLTNKTSVETVTPTKSASIEISVEEKSFVRALILSGVKATTASGRFGSITSTSSGPLAVISGLVRNIRVSGGRGTVKICGTTVKKLTTITARRGQLFFGNTAKKCSGSRFEGKLTVVNGKGDVTLQSSATTIVSISKQTGEVSLSQSSLGPVSVTNVPGPVIIASATVRRPAKLENIRGGILISATQFFGGIVVSQTKRGKVGATTIKETSFPKTKKKGVRLLVVRRGKFTMSNTNLANGTGIIKQIGGPVVFNGNGDAKISILGARRLHVFENNLLAATFKSCTGGLLMERNVIRNGKIDTCFGGVTLRQNVFRTLQCIGNRPAPGGKENSISKRATGQCAKFRR